MALATVPFLPKPIEKKTGLSRPETFTLTTRIEYAGEVVGHDVRPCRPSSEREGHVTLGSVRNPQSTWTPFSGCCGVGGKGDGGRSMGRTSVLKVTVVLAKATPSVSQMAPRPGVTAV